MRHSIIVAVLLVLLGGTPVLSQTAVFRRGDCNGDGRIDISDPVHTILALLATGQDPIACADACDVNDDGGLDAADAVELLTALFSGGTLPDAPFPVCGADVTDDDLGCQQYPPCFSPFISIAAGDVGTDSAVLWARTTHAGVVSFEVSTDRFFETILQAVDVTVTNPTVPAKTAIAGLPAATEIFYRATDAAGERLAGRFRTSPEDTSAASLRFGVSGDWRGELGPYPAIANAAARELDCFVALGDTIYADFPSPAVPAGQTTTIAEFRDKHAEVYSDRGSANPFRSLRSSTALRVTIDDHEVTDDFAGGAHPASDLRFDFTTEQFINETPLFVNALQVFGEYNPTIPQTYGLTGDPRTENKLKLYRTWRHGSRAAFFLLDGRSFRDEELPPVTDFFDLLEIVTFLAASLDTSRTMLGAAQLAELQADLLQAETDGVTWKFVLVPEPIQNLGIILASDRFEGYAAERNTLLQFIDTNGIGNVVFISADIHASIVNNLTYQLNLADPLTQVAAFEITTGPVAYAPSFGPLVTGLAHAYGYLSAAEYLAYQSLPDMDARDAYLTTLLDDQLTAIGYDPSGLAGSPINATLLQGSYVRAHNYGWTEFEVDGVTQELMVTIFGIEPYDEFDLASDPDLQQQVPQVLTRFTVQPQP